MSESRVGSMSVVIAVVVVVAMVVTLAASVITNIKTWQMVRESWVTYRRLPRDRRRRLLSRMSAMYAFLLAWFALILIAPPGVRDTLLYFVGVPVIVVVPMALIALGDPRLPRR